MSIKENQDKLHTLYWLPKFRKRPHKARFIAVQFVRDHCIVQPVNFMPYCCQKNWIRYYEAVYERDGINHFWSIKYSSEVLNKF